jgi:hypothetical protein
MPTTYKVLGQLEPSATTLSTIYTVPSATQTVVSTVFITNVSSAIESVRIAVRPAGESIENKHYIYYDSVLPSYKTNVSTIGLALNASDVVSVWSSNGNVSFSLFGSEIS